MTKYFVYILLCNDGSFYTGFTNNLDLRIRQHKQGINKESYTYTRRPIELKYYAYFTKPSEGLAFEKRIKGWTRKKKLAIIESNWERLKKLSVCGNETHHKNKSNDIKRKIFD